jgi:hypothetical protein
MRRVITALVVLIGLCAPAYAQRTTGSIVGTVTDESGAVLPGVTVTLTGAGVAGTPTTVTGETGTYRFPSLPPGTYRVSFAIAGFTTVNREEIVVPLGQAVEINVQLKVSTLQETVTVTGESPVVNTTSTQISTNLNREWVENAPQRRFTFFDLINQTAGVSPATSTSSRSQSFGSSATDNSYQLDGTDFTAPSTGAAWPWPNTDAIEEVETLSLGASAEYGNVQGAVFNVVTRQGSNQFKGDANLYFQHQNLTDRNTDDELDSGLPYNRDKFMDTTWQLGGPLVHDKLWFFGSFQYQEDAESQPGTDPAFPARSSAKRFFGKLNYQVSENNKIQFQYHDDFYRIPERATEFTAPTALVVENGHNPSPGLTWTSVLSNKTFVEARYSGFYGVDHGDPLEEGEPRVNPRFHDLDTGEITGGIYSWYDGNAWKSAVSGKVSHYAENFIGGSHDLKLGVQFDSGGSDYIRGLNDYIYTYGSTVAYGYTQLPWHQGGQKRSIGTYVDDTFRIGSRVTLNLGLRYDWSRASIRSYPNLDAAGEETGSFSDEISNVYTWNSVSPRVGFIYRLNEAGKSILKAHAGRYYGGAITSEFDNIGPSVTPRFLFDGTYVNGQPNLGSLDLVSDNSNLAVDPDYKNPHTDQYIIGFEQELIANVGVQISYVHKRGEDFGGWQEIAGEYQPVQYVDNVGADASGQTFTLFRLLSDPNERLFQLTNPEGMYMRYNGLSMQAQKRMSNRWQLTGSLVLSKATGRLGSSRPLSTATSGPLSIQNSTAGVFGQNPNDFVNTDGRLIGDRPVVGKVNFLYEAPGGVTLGVNFTHQTGRLWTRVVQVSGLGFPTRPVVNLEPNTGDRRVPDWNLFDVRVQKDFAVGGTARIGVFGDILNLTNSNVNEGMGERRADNPRFGDAPIRFIYPRRLMLGAKVRF